MKEALNIDQLGEYLSGIKDKETEITSFLTFVSYGVYWDPATTKRKE